MNNKIGMKITSGILLGTMLLYSIPAFAYTKEESVYAKLDGNGNCYQTTVSDHLKNTDNNEFLNDLSNLLNIENVSGDQELDKNGNSLTWKANGEDIYYKGNSENALPIECKINYELNGKEISKDEIIGKQGKVKIILKYTNRDSHTVDINGKQVTMYTPFVVACGTVIDNENNKNIEITNGKVIDDGTKTMVFGLAMPGMQESLGLSKDTIEIPDTVEISMDAKDFEMNSMYVYATPKIIEESDLDVFNKLDSIYEQANTLQSSTNMIEDGANTLKNGTNTYYEKSKEFNSAINKVSAGVSNINSNYSQIDTGINKLYDGTKSVENGANKLNDGIKLLNSKLTDLPSSTSKLYSGSAKLEKGISEVKAGVTQLETTVTDNVKQLVANNVTLNNTIETLKIAGYTENDDVIINLQKQIKSNNSTIAKLTSDESKKSIVALNDGLEELKNGSTNLKAGLNKLDSSAKELPAALKQLTEGTEDLSKGSKTLTSGAGTLSKGSTAIKSGMQTLNKSTNELTSANGQLTDGAATLNEGATTLSSGITKLNKEGISVICGKINGDVKDLQIRLEKLQGLANDYNSFSMIDGDAEGSVKFIIMIDSLKKDNAKEQAVVEEKKY